ncbi:unnamed protein product [Euphydryas editha]|uniref:(+)RNA virus helicase C-terminal domain-containing protein n=1 Tax=Euphydryas editha TaxID=104508 RepID=A0AAU9V0N0_EUPED|nr:unnamed protein product [Euphydryas editha]
MERFTSTQILERQEQTKYLVFTQEEKKTLINREYGTRQGSGVMTNQEAQGQTCEGLIIVQTKARRLRIYDSVPYAVVAMTRHTEICVYYTDDGGDAIGRFVKTQEGGGGYSKGNTCEHPPRRWRYRKETTPSLETAGTESDSKIKIKITRLTFFFIRFFFNLQSYYRKSRASIYINKQHR